MVPSIRSLYNQSFSQEKYTAFLESINSGFQVQPTFRVAETPVFIPADLKSKLIEACDHISQVVCNPDFGEWVREAIHLPDLLVPNEDTHPLFLQYDFGICLGEDGELTPQLIELQGFPSLYFFQHLLANCYREHFDIPDDYSHLFSGLDSRAYLDLLRTAIIGEHDPENVVLLDIEPEKQNTYIDFKGVQDLLGIEVLCLSQLILEGKDLFYIRKDGRRVPVYRIFNRVILDELHRRKDLERQFNLTEEVNAEWAGHPNWFMKISKLTLPFLQSPYVPETYFTHELDTYPDNLEDFVLKPLFSFSGEGVRFHVQPKDLDEIRGHKGYILQKKVRYAPCIQTPNPADPAKCEIRMMMVWLPGEPSPILVNNLIRLTKGEMVGVKYNKDKDWVGASVGFFPVGP